MKQTGLKKNSNNNINTENVLFENHLYITLTTSTIITTCRVYNLQFIFREKERRRLLRRLELILLPRVFDWK